MKIKEVVRGVLRAEELSPGEIFICTDNAGDIYMVIQDVAPEEGEVEDACYLKEGEEVKGVHCRVGRIKTFPRDKSVRVVIGHLVVEGISATN